MGCSIGEEIAKSLSPPNNNSDKKDDDSLVLISKSEKEAIRERFPKINIVRTMRQRSKRHRYYCEEAPQVMRYLNDLRRKDVAYAAGAKRKRV